jgi:hypothetical protein
MLNGIDVLVSPDSKHRANQRGSGFSPLPLARTEACQRRVEADLRHTQLAQAIPAFNLLAPSAPVTPARGRKSSSTGRNSSKLRRHSSFLRIRRASMSPLSPHVGWHRPALAFFSPTHLWAVTDFPGFPLTGFPPFCKWPWASVIRQQRRLSLPETPNGKCSLLLATVTMESHPASSEVVQTCAARFSF